MTADKPQRYAHRMGGKFRPAASGPAARADASHGTLTGSHFLRPTHGKLAGFGGATAEIQAPGTPVPIWFAALLASHCQAKARGEDRDVRWHCVSGRAVYTNRGEEEETIEPLGVCLQGGHSVAVSWGPGETAYTVEVFRQFDCVS